MVNVAEKNDRARHRQAGFREAGDTRRNRNDGRGGEASRSRDRGKDALLQSEAEDRRAGVNPQITQITQIRKLESQGECLICLSWGIHSDQRAVKNGSRRWRAQNKYEGSEQGEVNLST